MKESFILKATFLSSSSAAVCGGLSGFTLALLPPALILANGLFGWLNGVLNGAADFPIDYLTRSLEIIGRYYANGWGYQVGVVFFGVIQGLANRYVLRRGYVFFLRSGSPNDGYTFGWDMPVAVLVVPLLLAYLTPSLSSIILRGGNLIYLSGAGFYGFWEWFYLGYVSRLELINTKAYQVYTINRLLAEVVSDNRLIGSIDEVGVVKLSGLVLNWSELSDAVSKVRKVTGVTEIDSSDVKIYDGLM